MCEYNNIRKINCVINYEKLRISKLRFRELVRPLNYSIKYQSSLRTRM